MSKPNKQVTKTYEKKKPKNNTLIYLAAGLIIGVLILSFFTGVLNTSAEIGKVEVISGQGNITPFSNTVREITGGNENIYPIYEIASLPENIPEIVFDKELYFKYEGKTLNDFSFFMYSENSSGEIKSVYENIPQFNHPKNESGEINPGEYTVKIKFSWGSNEKNSITEEHFFKIIYN